jgi:hypothetical protein
MPGAAEPAYVFAYGSLAELSIPLAIDGVAHAPVLGRLHGHRRLWGVAMNNWEEFPARKHFLDPETGRPPRVRVAFLDLEEEAGETVNGVAIPVDCERLAALDLRERRYQRVEAEAFEPTLDRPVHVYVGREDARERARPAAADAPIVISEEYLARVRRAFDSLGPGALAEFDRTTEPPPFPLRALERILPGSGLGGGF